MSGFPSYLVNNSIIYYRCGRAGSGFTTTSLVNDSRWRSDKTEVAKVHTAEEREAIVKAEKEREKKRKVADGKDRYSAAAERGLKIKRFVGDEAAAAAAGGESAPPTIAPAEDAQPNNAGGDGDK